MAKITYIDEVEIKNKRVLLRVDTNVSLTPQNTIANDARIKQILPTVNYLLKNKNTVIIISYLGRPKIRDQKFSLNIVVERLQEYFPRYKVVLVNDFYQVDKNFFKDSDCIYVLENIRFYPQEKHNDQNHAKKLASLGDVYVNDAFGQSHRIEASIVSVPKYLPSYGGLLLKKEVEMIKQISSSPQKPLAAIIGGAKVSTKIGLIKKLTEIADYVLIGGGLANTFICAQGYDIGTSFCEYEAVNLAKQLLDFTKKTNTNLILPVDAVVGQNKDSVETRVVKINQIPRGTSIFDIGPETQALFGSLIAKAKTIIWNGPVGYFENPAFRRGTDFIYYSIAQNETATSIVGGGDTLAAISKKEYFDKITHISTGGGAMLELIEKGTLPGIEALKN